MDLNSFLFYMFGLVSTLYVVHFGVYLVGANLYDMRQFRKRQLAVAALVEADQDQEPQDEKRIWRGRPIQKGLVTIAIAAHNETAVIVRCLESIHLSQYLNYEILVADDASTDGTRQLVRDYIQRHPDQNVQVFRMRKNVGKGGALNAVLRRYARGEFVMTMDADSLITPDTIQNSIRYFQDKNVAGVAANVQILDEPTVLGMLQKFEHMVGYRSKKTYSLLNCEFVVGGVASCYRMSVLRQVGFYDTDTVTEDIGLSTKIVSLGNRRYRMVYAADVVAMTEPVSSFRALVRQRYRWKYGSFQNLVKYRRLICNPSSRYSHSLTMYRMPMAVLSEIMLLASPFAWGYVLYMTLALNNLQLVVGAYLTITAYMLITVWFDEHLRFTNRLRLSVYALVAYFIFYIMDLVQLIGMIHCLVNSQKLFKQHDIGSTWVSPKRIGRQVVGLNEA
jgi:biofilm PGA synthesis N-glycosyltransferase PgaC